jgi:pimeloyl-ACP methyl ester carboxylesterase
MPKVSRKRIILGLICLIIIVPIILYVAAPKLIVKQLIGLQRKAAKLTVKSAVVGDHTIVYSEGGTGETILMVHGFGGNKDNWLRFAKWITPQYHVIILDLPGYGESTRLENARYNIMAQVERLKAFCKGLGISQFHIVGNSMGGNISGNYAAKYPEMVKTLALFNASGVNSPVRSERERLIEKGFNPMLVHSRADFDRYLKFIFAKPPVIPAIAKRVFAEEAAADKSKNEKLFKDMLMDNFDLEGNLSKIPQLTLILWGDTDQVLDVSSVSIFERIKNHKKVIMKDCGHVPMIERPEETASLYLDFLKGSH